MAWWSTRAHTNSMCAPDGAAVVANRRSDDVRARSWLSFGFGDNELGPEVRQAIGTGKKDGHASIRPHRIALGGGCGETARVVSNQWLGAQPCGDGGGGKAAGGRVACAGEGDGRGKACLRGTSTGSSSLRSGDHTRTRSWSASGMTRDHHWHRCGHFRPQIRGVYTRRRSGRGGVAPEFPTPVSVAAASSRICCGPGMTRHRRFAIWRRSYPDLAGRAMGLAVTGQGDGCWLIDADGNRLATP